MSDPTELAHQLGFTPAWFGLGIVDAAAITRLQGQWDFEEDRHPEHYRYGAFREFLASHRPLDPAIATSLFELGASDPDYEMGGSMMAHIVRLPECSQAVLKAAADSGRKHLIALVNKRMTLGEH